MCDIDTYECSDKGILFPLTNEYTWSVGFRATLYLILLFWCFLGVSIIADVFMSAIETITSRKQTIRIADPKAEEGYTEIQILVWNGTVANLTLMALGSSAPEILLSIIEIVGKQFHAGDLGPGTIVGSAAFNLMVITAICIASIPAGECRRINSIKVFAVTAVFSVWAYIWLLIILVAITPDYVDLWEAFITLLMFPMMVMLAYLADKEFCGIPLYFAEMIRTVFAVTAVFSVWAYIWLLIILVAITPDYVDLWEAFITLLMFPMMVMLAYLADKEFCGRKTEDKVKSQLDLEALMNGDEIPDTDDIKADKRLMLEFVRKLRHEKGYSEKDVALLASYIIEKDRSHSRSWYRRNAIRNMTGSAKLVPSLDEHTKELLDTMLIAEDVTSSRASFYSKPEYMHKAVVEFAAPTAAVLERDGRVKLTIVRHGDLTQRVVFKVETCDGTAEAGSDYVAVKRTMVFEPKQSSQDLEIEIVDDNIWEPDEVFFVRITIEADQKAVPGRRQCCQVVILNDDNPGTVQFDKPSYMLKESCGTANIPVQRVDGADVGPASNRRVDVALTLGPGTVQFDKPSYMFKESCGTANIPVQRVDGADGPLKIKWSTKDISATGGRDYDNTSGELEFGHGEVEKHIEIIINDDMEFEKDENFELILESIDCKGAKLGRTKRTVVTIVNDDEFDGFVSRIANLTNSNLDALRVQRATWGQQFVQAMNVNGGDIEHASVFDYVMHFLTFGWKLLFAIVPPSTIWGGWLCFFCSLAMIGFLTLVIGDVAGTFGCLIGLKDTITAITFVALGTSLPDTFASRTAAMNEKTADNSIGNVTGSNAVNVFLGLGLPWVIASIYWTVQGKTFEVPAGSLGFNVTIFTVCAVTTICVIMARRYITCFGGELGGAKVPKIVCSVLLVCLWIFYILMASMQVEGHIEGF